MWVRSKKTAKSKKKKKQAAVEDDLSILPVKKTRYSVDEDAFFSTSKKKKVEVVNLC